MAAAAGASAEDCPKGWPGTGCLECQMSMHVKPLGQYARATVQRCTPQTLHFINVAFPCREARVPCMPGQSLQHITQQVLCEAAAIS